MARLEDLEHKNSLSSWEKSWGTNPLAPRARATFTTLSAQYCNAYCTASGASPVRTDRSPLRAEPGAPGEPESQAPCTYLHGGLHWDMVTLPAGPGLVL